MEVEDNPGEKRKGRRGWSGCDDSDLGWVVVVVMDGGWWKKEADDESWWQRCFGLRSQIKKVGEGNLGRADISRASKNT